MPDLMNQLFTWLKQSKYHPLVKSCVFHYEFEFIHPFADGNGRTGRLWQSLILQKWKEVFAWIPIETFVHENQEEYYKVLQRADTVGDSTEFVEFMLRMIRNALKEFCSMRRLFSLQRQNLDLYLIRRKICWIEFCRLQQCIYSL